MEPGIPDLEKDELGPAETRILALIEEFGRRQRKRPDLVVRPWWTACERIGDGARSPSPSSSGSRIGFIVEYCPSGRESAELRVTDRTAVVEGPAGSMEARLGLTEGWCIDGADTGSPELLVNRLLALAEDVLDRPHRG